LITAFSRGNRFSIDAIGKQIRRIYVILKVWIFELVATAAE
jgi:hypothetical protein